MIFSELKTIVGTAGVKIKSSSFRFSELRSLVEKAAAMEQGVLTIVVEDGTLNFSEVRSLTDIGKQYVSFDFTER